MSYDFSVAMCVYGKDNPKHFDIAFKSVINQTVVPKELVLTIDGPIPDSIKLVIQKYKKILPNYDIVFKVIQLEKNMGHGEARRVCFDNCSYSLIALMDADDISRNDRFEKELMVFENDRKVAIVGSHVSEFCDSPNNIMGKRVVELFDDKIKKDMKSRCPMNQPTVMFKKQAVASVGGYLDWYCNEDYYLWIRLAKAGYKFANIDDCLVYMRVDSKSYQRRGGQRYFRSEKNIQKLLLKNQMIGVPKYITNIGKRWIVQVVLPNRLRQWVFKTFARK